MSQARLTRYWLLTLAAAVLAVVLLWGFLVKEHRRLTPAQGVLVWASEAVAGFWFLRFGWRHLLRGEPVATPGPRERWVIVGTLLAGGLVDGGMTFYKLAEEEAAQAVAVPGEAAVVAGRHQTDWFGVTYYYLHATFTGPDGVARPVDVTDTLPGVPPAVRAAVEAGLLPVGLPILYDAGFPARTWIPGEVAHNGMYTFGCFALIFQFIGLMLVYMISSDPTIKRPPNWAVVAETGPFAVAAWTTLLAGVTRWVPGQPCF